MMDSDDLRSILETAGVDVWAFIDTAIAVASSDYPSELKQRRDKIVQALYSATATCNRCSRGGGGGGNGREAVVKHNNSSPSPAAIEARGGGRVAAAAGIRRLSPETEEEEEEEEEEEKVDVEEGEEDVDPYAGLFDDEQRRVLEIKQQLEDPDQTEDSLVDLLQTLEDMDITFKALKETDIGRHVNRLRKHSSNDVKRLVKLLVRKWKEIVDEWVRLNPQGEHASSALMADGDSPQQQQKITQNGHHQVPDFAYSPNPHNGSSGSDRNYSEPEVVVRKQKPPVSSSGTTVVRREAPPARQQAHQHHSAASTTGYNNQRQQQQQQREGNSNFDSDRLASARKRLQESYKEAENAKRQRTIQVMDIHEIPKPKNTFFAKNKGGGSQGKHW